MTGTVYAVASYPECHEEVTDADGYLAPCEKPAVRDRLDPEEGSPYPVCAEHDRPPYPCRHSKFVQREEDGATWLACAECGIESAEAQASS